jgi:FkbM family methyltransferase
VELCPIAPVTTAVLASSKPTREERHAAKSAARRKAPNVGVASLFFASLPHVQEVHSFEPFPAPFARGLKNFDLNPKLARKIRPHNVGLGKTTESRTTLYDDASTIAVSIHGLDRGEPTTINIESASENLA